MKTIRIIIAISCLLIFIMSANINAISDDWSTQTYYKSIYQRKAPKQLPINPKDPISKEEALTRKLYYIGYHNSIGQLIRLEEYTQGHYIWRYRYSYHSNGRLWEYWGENIKGRSFKREYNEKGDLVKDLIIIGRTIGSGVLYFGRTIKGLGPYQFLYEPHEQM